MRTTLGLHPGLWARLVQLAADEGKTTSELVEAAIRDLLRRRRLAKPLSPLPSFDGGGALVDVAERDEL
ncbi:MAG: ribbon-helix-helix protein, CopG family [Planctomycetes bacterium]|nr:ribbon-helix-helix protein, CopG family [Planctomycetota bacterium]